MEYYSVVKNNEVLIHCKMWIYLENIMLSGRIETQNVTYCKIPLI